MALLPLALVGFSLLVGGDDSDTFNIDPDVTGIDEVNGGVGNDVLNINALITNVFGGMGNDEFNINAAMAMVSGGAGDDEFNINAATVAVSGDAGEDQFNINAAVTTANGGADNDTFVVSSNGSATAINGDEGNDSVSQDTVGLVGTYNGNDGIDSLTILNGDSVWTINPDLTDPINPIDVGNGSVAVDGMPMTATAFNSVETRIGSISGRDTVNLSNFGAATILLANFQNFNTIMGSSDGTLQGIDGQQNDWLINSLNSGNVTVNSITTDFTGFSNLIGGNGIDSFEITEGGEIGVINGGLGSNTLTRSNLVDDNAWVLTGEHQGTVTYGDITTNGGVTTNFSNIQSVEGSNSAGVTDTLTGRNQNNRWIIDDDASGNVAADIDTPSDTLAFMNMENLMGGSASDVFDITQNGILVGGIDGGMGDGNLLRRSNTSGDNAWALTGEHQGTVTYRDITTNEEVITNFSNIQLVEGSNSAGVTDTLTGRNQNNRWIIDGDDASGNVAADIDTPSDTLAFMNMENLVGGSASDVFDITQNGILAGYIDGGMGDGNLLRRSNTSGDNAWALTGEHQGTVTYRDITTNEEVITNFSNIQAVAGSSDTGVVDTLTGHDQNNSWVVDGNGSGRVSQNMANPTDTLDFMNMENLVGRSLIDTFDITQNGILVGGIDGGMGEGNLLRRSNTSGDNAWVLTGEHQGTVTYRDITTNEEVITNFSNIQAVAGSSDTGVVDTLTGHDQNNSWVVDGNGSGRVSQNMANPTDTLDFMNMENLVGRSLIDTFDITQNGILVGDIDGGMGNNLLRRSNTSGDNAWALTGEHQGTVTYRDITTNGEVITNFSNIQSVEGSDNAGITDTLTGHNQNNRWIIDGNASGNVAADIDTPSDTLAFMNMENLVGRSLIDTFDITQNGILVGGIDGGMGEGNLLRRSNTSGDNAWVLTGEHQGTVTYRDITTNEEVITNFSNIQAVAGSSDTGVVDTLTGSDQNNSWVVDDNGSGRVSQNTANETLDFMNMENLIGGNLNNNFDITATIGSITTNEGNDTITVVGSGLVTGDIVSGAGNDTITLVNRNSVGLVDGGMGSDTVSLDRR